MIFNGAMRANFAVICKPRPQRIKWLELDEMTVRADSQIDSFIVPLGAGDLIDRAVRFYRSSFLTLIIIATPPVLAATVISIGWTMIGRYLFPNTSDPYSVAHIFYIAFAWSGSALIWLAESIATLVVMGGASRNFVGHLLHGEAITFRETYRNAWNRLPGLLAASTIVIIFLGTIGLAILYFGLIITFVVIAVIITVFEALPVIAFLLGIIAGIGGLGMTLWIFFLAASLVAYVPQVMLVEGQGVFAAIGRSASLSSWNVRRLAALLVFTTVATYSALALLYLPLAWYASSQGVPLMAFDADLIPAWYEVSYNLIWQVSFILLSPVWMIGLCLLYVDERVRREGYDMELMAASRLGEIPNVPAAYVNPLRPAISDRSSACLSDSEKR